MKLVCIDNIYNRHRENKKISLPITIGKEYDGYLVDNYYRIIDDNGSLDLYRDFHFITLEESRNKKLEELGI